MNDIFIPGDRWVYYKIYTGAFSAQSIFIDQLLPHIRNYEKENILEKWFFVRYSDPDFHLRLRMEIDDDSKILTIIRDFSEALKDLVSKNIVWKIELSTYKREIERYGKMNISLTESLFYLSSTRVSNLLAANPHSDKYSFDIIQSVNEILTMFGLSIDEKLAFAKANRDYFKTEYQTKKTFNNRIQIESIRLKNIIINTFPSDNKLLPYKTSELRNIVESIKNNLQSTNVPVLEYLSSIVHMHLNRAFIEDIRYYEYVLHSMLFKYYASEKARK